MAELFGKYIITEGSPLITAINEPKDTPSVVEAFSVSPNPSKDNVMVEIDMKQSEAVDLKLYDISGKMVKIIANNTLLKGKHTFNVNKSQLQLDNGTYQLVLKTGNQTLVQRVVIVQ